MTPELGDAMDKVYTLDLFGGGLSAWMAMVATA
jgi:hypothetical protein